MDWLRVLQVAKNCTRYACKTMGEPFSDEWESEGAYRAYEVGVLYQQGKVVGPLDKYLAFCVIRQVRTEIIRRRRKQRVVKITDRDVLANGHAKNASNGLLSDIETEDTIFIERLLEGKKCQKKIEMIQKYATPSN